MKVILGYYDDHADAFCNSTLSADLSRERRGFLDLLPTPAKILDAGSGSGRDSLAFLQLGHEVIAIDASSEMVAATERLAGVRSLQMKFEDIDFHQDFDGVWACASLLHVPRAEISTVLQRIRATLKPQGILYASFKYGTSKGMRNGRWFVDYDESKLAELAVPEFSILRTWVSPDARPERRSERWLNVLMKRTR